MGGCNDKLDLDQLQLRIWQPEGVNYFDAADTITLTVRNLEGEIHTTTGGALEDLDLNLSSLQVSDTPIEIFLEMINVPSVHLPLV